MSKPNGLPLWRKLLILGACLGSAAALAVPGTEMPGATAWQTLAVMWIATVALLSVPLDQHLLEGRAYVWILSVLWTTISGALATLYIVAGQMPPSSVLGAVGAGVVVAIATWTRGNSQQLSPKTALRADAARLVASRQGLLACAAVVAITWIGPSAVLHLKLGWWLSQQPTHNVGDARLTPIRVVVFTDYQCPACAARHQDYDKVIAAAQAQSGGDLQTDTFDYPLDTACNQSVQSSLHPAACDAAVLVRATTTRQQRKEVIDELFDHQQGMTPTSVSEMARAFGLQDQYIETRSASLREIEGDVKRATMAGVSSTPTYFVNGIRANGWTSGQLEMILHYLLTQR